MRNPDWPGGSLKFQFNENMLFPLVRASLSGEWIPPSKVPKEAKFLWVDYLVLVEKSFPFPLLDFCKFSIQAMGRAASYMAQKYKDPWTKPQYFRLSSPHWYYKPEVSIGHPATLSGPLLLSNGPHGKITTAITSPPQLFSLLLLLTSVFLVRRTYFPSEAMLGGIL